MSDVAAPRSWDSLRVGERAQIEKHITHEDIAAFAALSGDYNPLHTERGVVHGMYLGALVSALVGMHLPGEKALLVTESLSFKKPVRAGDTVVVAGTLTHKSDAVRVVTIAIAILVEGVPAAEGVVQVQVQP